MKAQTRPILDRIKTALVGLKMPRALEILDDTVARIERGELPALQAIETLLSEEVSIRETRRVRTALTMARLTPIKTLASFDFTFQPSIDRDRILTLAELGFVDRCEAVYMLGPPGTGKSQVSMAVPGSRPRGRRRSRWLRRRDRGSDPVPGMPGTGTRCRCEPGRFGFEDPERSEDRLVTVMQSARSGRADGQV